MLLVNKKVGETPLELIERIRTEQPEFKDAKLSYAGRLDPMAEGAMLILVGEENKNREKFLGLDKEYIVTFLGGVQTDTGDILGLIQKTSAAEISKLEIENKLETLKEIKQQTYPWFSGQTVDGVKLFDHYKAGNTDIERPTRSVEIKEVELLNFGSQKMEDVKEYIFESIEKVKGDFRQEQILKKWADFFNTVEQGSGFSHLTIFEVRILVSSGTYIRVLTENFGFPVSLLKLNRTRIS